MTEQEKAEYRLNMEEIIKDRGHFIQGVIGDGVNFAYTIGRSESGKPELYFPNFNAVFTSVIDKASAELDKGTITIGKPFHIDGWKTKKGEQPTWFVIDFANKEQREEMIGAYSRGTRMGYSLPDPLVLIIADADNKLPVEYTFH